MAGLHLKQLIDGVVAQKTTINTALTTASLTALTDLVGRPVAEGKRHRPPWGSVGLQDRRERQELAARAGGTVVTDERVYVDVELHVDGTEAEAAAYEGVVANSLRNAKAALDTAVSDASIVDWRLTDGSAAEDEETVNRDAWTVTITLRADLEW